MSTDQITYCDTEALGGFCESAGMVSMAEKIRRFRKQRGLSQGQLGKRIGRDTQYVYRVEGGQEITVEEAEKIAAALEVSFDEFVEPAQIPRTVPLVGYVGAGDLYYPEPEAGPWVGFDSVDAPPGSPGVVAVRVRGNSMAPVFRHGCLLYFAKEERMPPQELIGEDCIVQVRNGPAYIKALEKGTRAGRYNLVSYNKETPTIENADVEWASPVVWSKRSQRRRSQ